VTGPVTITYDDPFPTNNGSWGSGAMMGVVMHTMVGNLQPTTVNLFNSSAAAVSAHFGIAGRLGLAVRADRQGLDRLGGEGRQRRLVLDRARRRRQHREPAD
jgi:hypothetical protein